jgi:hypothetical protein
MPFLYALGGYLLELAASLAGRVLIALSIGFVTYSGFDLSIGWLLTQIQGYVGSMPAEVISFMGFLWVDKAIGFIISAYSAAMVVKLAGSTSFTKMITKGK